MGINRKTLLALAGLVGLCCVLPASASAGTADTYGRGVHGVKVHASIEYSEPGTPKAGKRNNVKVMIERNGEPVLLKKPNPKALCRDCGYYVGFNPVEVIQLDSTREPEVIFNVFSGGAHCCTSSLIYRYANGKYRLSRHDWGNHPYMIRKLRRKPRLVTVDDRFAYTFDCYACSAYPVQVWKYRKGRLKNVTKLYRGLIGKDAKTHKKAWQRARKTGRAAAPLAAWYADRCLLNRCARSLRKIKRLVRNKGAVREFQYGDNHDYLKTLRKTIKRLGYAK